MSRFLQDRCECVEIDDPYIRSHHQVIKLSPICIILMCTWLRTSNFMCAFAMAVNSYVKFFIRNAVLGMVVSFWFRKDVTLLLLAMKMTYPELFCCMV